LQCAGAPPPTRRRFAALASLGGSRRHLFSLLASGFALPTSQGTIASCAAIRRAS
jgi:hypothetical protein